MAKMMLAALKRCLTHTKWFRFIMVALHPALRGMPLAFIAILSCIELARLRLVWRETLRATRAIAIIAVVVSTGAVSGGK